MMCGGKKSSKVHTYLNQPKAAESSFERLSFFKYHVQDRGRLFVKFGVI